MQPDWSDQVWSDMACFEVTVSQHKASQDLAYATEIRQNFFPLITCAKSYVLFDTVGHRVTSPFFINFVRMSKNLFAVGRYEKQNRSFPRRCILGVESSWV